MQQSFTLHIRTIEGSFLSETEIPLAELEERGDGYFTSLVPLQVMRVLLCFKVIKAALLEIGREVLEQ